MSDNSIRNNPDNKDSVTTMIYLQLSDRLQQSGIVENIGLDTKANFLKVNLNHGCKKTIVSTIFPIWAKTIHDFEKHAKRKNLTDKEIIDITDCLDDNHETILVTVVDNKIKTIYNNDNNQSNQEHEIVDEIKRIR